MSRSATGLPLQNPASGNCGLQPTRQGIARMMAFSSGVVATDHTNWAGALLARGECWTSALQGELCAQEVDYIELTYELFRDGMIQGVPIGMAFVDYMAALLGCPPTRFDGKCAADPRIAQLRSPPQPIRPLSNVERVMVMNKFTRVEAPALFLHDEFSRQRHDYNGRVGLGPKSAGAAEAATQSHAKRPRPLPERIFDSTRDHLVASRGHTPFPALYNAELAPTSTIEVGGGGAVLSAQDAVVAHASGQYVTRGVLGLLTSAAATAAATATVTAATPPTNGTTCIAIGASGSGAQTTRHPAASHPPQMCRSIVGTMTTAAAGDHGGNSNGGLPARPAVTSVCQPTVATAAAAAAVAAIAGPELPPTPSTYLDDEREVPKYNEGLRLQALSQGLKPMQAPSLPPPTPAPAQVRPLPNQPVDRASMGRAILGIGASQCAKATPSTQGDTKISHRKEDAAGRVVDRTDDGSSSPRVAGGRGAADGRALEEELRAPILNPTGEEIAAIEYLKWELHGKFMAFPGEDYHNLLAHLATEIYHYRYPVEHGVDVLQSVMRAGAPEAAQVCAATLRHWNAPGELSS